MTKTVNVFAFVAILAALILGVTGVVSWWVILLIALSTVKVELTFRD